METRAREKKETDGATPSAVVDIIDAGVVVGAAAAARAARGAATEARAPVLLLLQQLRRSVVAMGKRGREEVWKSKVSSSDVRAVVPKKAKVM